MKYKISMLSLAMATIVLVSMVAAAGVSAAKPVVNSASASPVGAPVVGAPASCYDGTQFWNVAQGAADVHGNTIYWQTPNLGSTWTALSPGTNPTVVAIGPGNVVILGTTGGVIWAKETVNYGASWTNVVLPTIAVKAGTGPTAVYLAATPELDVFYVAPAGNLMVAMLNLGTASTSSQNIGGMVFATPAATATSTSSAVVVVKGTGGTIYELPVAMGGPGLWTKFHDGTIGAGASLSSDGTNVFLTVSGQNSRLYMAWSDDGGVTWVTNFQQGLSLLNTHALYWANLGGVVTSAPSSAVTIPGSGYAEPLVRGSDGKIWDGGVTVPTPGVTPVFLITNVWAGPYAGP